MEQLNKTPITGKFGDVAKVLDTNFGLIVTKLMELSEAKKMNCGFYSSEAKLKTAYPNPDKGMMAYVGSGTDYTVYRCKTDGTWTATSETFKVDTSADFNDINDQLSGLANKSKELENKKADAEQVNNSLYDLEKKIGDRVVVEGDVTNLPDEEDLTSVKESECNVLKLADKRYAPENFSGKGYKRLRKNIQKIDLAVTKITVNSAPTKDGEISVNINKIDTHISLVKDTHNTPALVAQTISDTLVSAHTDYNIEVTENIITLTRKHSGEVTASAFDVADTEITLDIEDSVKSVKRNILTAEMINQLNTIYELMYDYDLDGTVLNLRENNILKFVGGKISNGKVRFYKNALTVNPNFENVDFEQVANDVLPYSINKLYTSMENLRNTTSVRYKDIVYLKTQYGIKPYEIKKAGEYLNTGFISLNKLKNIEAVPLLTSVNKGVINVTNYGIYPNGEDMSDKLNSFLSSAMKFVYNLSTLYFPGGVYKFTKPINFMGRCNIVGDDVSIFGNEYSGTVFDFSDIKNANENNSLWCITASQQLYKVSNIVFISNSYKLVENRKNILNTQTEAWTETISQKNICCINCAQYINECYFIGWSGSCVLGDFANVTNCCFKNNNLCLNFKNDCTAINIRAEGCNNIIRANALTTVSNVRGDSIREEAIIFLSGGVVNNVIIDWGYKSIFEIEGSNSAGLSYYWGYNYNFNIYRNVVNTKLLKKKTLDDIDVTYDMGAISIKRIDGIKKFNSNISIQGTFLTNIKDGGLNYETDLFTTISIPLTIDVETVINFNGVINIMLFDIDIEDVIADVSLVRNFIYMITGKATGEVVLNNRRFYLKELDKEHYDNEHIVYLGDTKTPCNGTTSKRPVNINTGFFFYDTTLNKPIWYTGEKWIDATGAEV